jgi:hypothetical protein
MGVEIQMMPARDRGTGEAEPIQGPVTTSAPVPEEPTGEAKQQDAEVTYSELSHEEKPVKSSEPSGPTTTTADFPTPEDLDPNAKKKDKAANKARSAPENKSKE